MTWPSAAYPWPCIVQYSLRTRLHSPHYPLRPPRCVNYTFKNIEMRQQSLGHTAWATRRVTEIDVGQAAREAQLASSKHEYQILPTPVKPAIFILILSPAYFVRPEMACCQLLIHDVMVVWPHFSDPTPRSCIMANHVPIRHPLRLQQKHVCPPPPLGQRRSSPLRACHPCHSPDVHLSLLVGHSSRTVFASLLSRLPRSFAFLFFLFIFGMGHLL